MAAAQAHYGHRQPYLFLAARGGAAAPMEMPQAHKEMTPTPTPTPQHPPLFFDLSHGDGDGGNARKRTREAEAPTRLLSMRAPQGSPGNKVISLAPRLHKRPTAATGIRFDLDEGVSEHVSCTSSVSSLLTDDELAVQCDRYRNETDRLFQEHAERLQRALADARRRHSRSLLGAAEAAAARRVREKEAEASRAARRGAELEERLARMRAEAAAWQAKALSDQSTAAALHAQLQQAVAAAQARWGSPAEEDDNAADDAESGFVDPDRVVEVVVAPPPPLPAARPCHTCLRRPASTVLLPCRHLCECDACEPAAVSASLAGTAAACPMCRCAVTGTVQVFF